MPDPVDGDDLVAPGATSSSVFTRVLRLRRGPTSVAGRRLLLFGALVLFVGIGVQAFRSLPADRPPFDWTLLVLLFLVGTPAMLVANAVEYRTLARLCEVHVGWSDAMVVSVIATAANLLPIPGAAIVRTVRLRQLGVGAGRIGSAIVSVGIGFLAAACFALAMGLVLVDEWGAVAITSLAGIALTIVCGVIEHRVVAGDASERLLLVLGTEAFVLVVVVVRLWVVLAALGAAAGFVEAVMLGSASVLSTTLAFFPGGLGVREGLSGILGTLVGLDAATGAFAATLDRLTFLVGAAVVSAIAAVAGWLPKSDNGRVRTEAGS